MRFPFRVSSEGLIFVQVTANDSINGEFLLDTGAGVHVVSQTFLGKLNSVPAGRYTGFRHTGERMDLELSQIASLSMGDYRQENPFVSAWDVLDKHGIDGVLSAKFFEHHIATIDLATHELIFEDEKSLQKILQHGQTADLKILDDRDKVMELFVDLLIGDSHIAECELDTGSDGLLILDARYLSLLKLDDSANMKQSEAKSVTGLTEERFIGNVPSIALQGAPTIAVTNPGVVFKRNLIFDGDLGIKFWENRRLTIDIPHRRIIVNG